MNSFSSRNNWVITIALVLPVIAWFYLGLFATMLLWYPAGVSTEVWREHLIHFSVIYCFWVIIFYSYRLFDKETLRRSQTFLARLMAVAMICFLATAIYFYFQPALLITPRRFLVSHILITFLGVFLWLALIRWATNHSTKYLVFAHRSVKDLHGLSELITKYDFLGLQYNGSADDYLRDNVDPKSLEGSLLIVSSKTEFDPSDAKQLFVYRNYGVVFLEFSVLYEQLTRTIHLDSLSDWWFVQSISYQKHHFYGIAKRVIDIGLAIVLGTIFIITFPIIALLIWLTSKGSIFFSQERVGQNRKTFKLYKYRTMTVDSSSDTWSHSGQTITGIGKFLRLTRLDELPQVINILKGDMSFVGPRPEQTRISEQLREQIPYYDERHIVKPGLTGWAQLHVYASSVEETRQKLQYDLYYIKHRSLLFDLEIILKTLYNTITLSGK